MGYLSSLGSVASRSQIFAILHVVIMTAVTEAASTKYEDQDSYKHEPEYYEEEYRDRHGYGGDSDGKSYSTYSSYKLSSYRYKRDLGEVQDVSNPEIMTLSYSFSVQGIRNARRDVCKYLTGGARDGRLDLCLYLIGY